MSNKPPAELQPEDGDRDHKNPSSPGRRIPARGDGTTAYRVQWREGGTRDGEKRSRTFDTVQEAVPFRGALVANGYRDPYEDPEWAAHLGVLPPAHW